MRSCGTTCLGLLVCVLLASGGCRLWHAAGVIGTAVRHRSRDEVLIRWYELEPRKAWTLASGTRVVVWMRDGTVYRGKYLGAWEVAWVDPGGKPAMVPAIRLELANLQTSIALHRIQRLRVADRSGADTLELIATVFLFPAYARLMVGVVSLPACAVGWHFPM